MQTIRDRGRPTGSAAVWAVLAAAAALAAGCGSRPAAPPAPGAVTAPVRTRTQADADYVGSAACVQCHAEEARTYVTSRHASTLHSMDPISLGALAPPGGRIPGSDIILDRQKDGYLMRIAGEDSSPLPVELAVGSGKTGMTYVAYLDGGLLELRKSYFPARRLWYQTPGHDRLAPGLIGLMYTRQQSVRCILCHATTLEPGQIIPDKRFYGVGCESCHGPGSLHVAAMQAGKTSLFMDTIAEWSATRINTMCGRCHRTIKDVPKGTGMSAGLGSDDGHTRVTNRFQGYGLMLSRCFRESGARLSCVDCHNPHANASTDPRHFEAVCLKCHGSSAPAAAPSGSGGLIRAKPCPVNPTRGCVHCHMPLRKAFSQGSVPTLLPEHRIGIYAGAG